MSRLRESPDKLFEVFLEVGKSAAEDEEPFILQKYPLDYSDEEVLKSVPKFAFPCDTERTTVDHFTFTLTDVESCFKFGFCRHATGAQTCLCIVSCLPWFEVFYGFLNTLAEITNRSDLNDVTVMLRAAYVQEVPSPGVPVTVVAQQEMFSFTSPDTSKLPSIPASRNLTEYYNAIDVGNMMIIFASMLHERRIVVTSKKLSRLTGVIHAASSLLYPMYWQHLFIPVLPSFLLEYLTAPMPFVIGVHTNLLKKVKESELGDAVLVNADENTVSTEYDDLNDLPDEISSSLKRHMKGEKVKHSMQGSGDVISKTFMMALVKLIGGYRDALMFKEGEPITFNPEAFVQSRPISMQPFLQNILHLQIFQQFINDRLVMLNSGIGFTDIFEKECLLHADKLNAQSRYKEWLHNMKKQGKKLQRGGKDVWSDFKVKVKNQGKKAYSGIKTKIGDMKKDESPFKGSKSTKNLPKESPGLSKDRPSTIVGAPLTTQRPPRPPVSPVSPLGSGKPAMRPKTVRKPSSENRLSRYIKSPEELRVSADDSDVLRYSRVSCNLISDPDIQLAIYKSASAENLPGPDPHLKNSDSSSSDSSVDKEHYSLPCVDGQDDSMEAKKASFISYQSLLDDDDSGIVLTASQTSIDKTESSSSNTNFYAVTIVPPPRPPPRKSKSPKGVRRNDDSPTHRQKTSDSDLPNRQRRSLELATQGSGDLLINLDTPVGSGGDNKPIVSESFESLTSAFDAQGLNSAGDYVKLRDTPVRQDSANRRSINRTPAVKLPPHVTPNRPSIRREQSPVSPDEGEKDVSVFDPLWGNSSPSMHLTTTVEKGSLSSVITTSPQTSHSDSLLKSWEIHHLTPGTNIQSLSYDYGQSGSAVQLPGQGYTNTSLYLSPQPFIQRTVVNTPIKPVNAPTVLKSLPHIPPRPENRPPSQSGLMFTPQLSSCGSILKPQSSSSENLSEKADPFADLVSLNRESTSRQPKQSEWEQFD